MCYSLACCEEELLEVFSIELCGPWLCPRVNPGVPPQFLCAGLCWGLVSPRVLLWAHAGTPRAYLCLEGTTWLHHPR